MGVTKAYRIREKNRDQMLDAMRDKFCDHAHGPIAHTVDECVNIVLMSGLMGRCEGGWERYYQMALRFVISF